jgi:hypothetical protein
VKKILDIVWCFGLFATAYNVIGKMHRIKKGGLGKRKAVDDDEPGTLRCVFKAAVIVGRKES